MPPSIVPSIVDALPAGGMAAILADPERRALHVATIVEFAAEGDAVAPIEMKVKGTNERAPTKIVRDRDQTFDEEGIILPFSITLQGRSAHSSESVAQSVILGARGGVPHEQ